MTILTKIIEGEEIYNKVMQYLLEASSISVFNINNQKYYLFYPYQALALQRLGAKLEFYRTNRPLYREVPIVPENVNLELSPKVKPGIIEEDKEKFEEFVNKLERAV